MLSRSSPSCASRLGGATTQPAIDPHDVTRQSIGTTVRLPLGQRVLVAGMTMEPSTAGNGRALYLVLEVDAVR